MTTLRSWGRKEGQDFSTPKRRYVHVCKRLRVDPDDFAIRKVIYEYYEKKELTQLLVWLYVFNSVLSQLTRIFSW